MPIQPAKRGEIIKQADNISQKVQNQKKIVKKWANKN